MKNYTFQLTGLEVQLIGKALGAMPYVQVTELITKMRVQAEASPESRWEHVARNALPPEEFERLAAAVAGQP